MIDPSLGRGVLISYGVLLVAVGLLGYVKAGSPAWLIAGTIGGLLAFAALAATRRGGYGLRMGEVLAFVAMALCGIRLAQTRKLIRSGVLAIICLVILALLAL